jgi:hypothetical protein
MNTDMKKETAVEYMFRLLDVLTFGKDNETQNIFNDILKQAKAMEKEQIIEAHGLKRVHHVQQGVDYWVSTCGLEYYDNTYGGDK